MTAVHVHFDQARIVVVHRKPGAACVHRVPVTAAGARSWTDILNQQLNQSTSLIFH